MIAKKCILWYSIINMSKFVARHSLSEANNRENHGTLLFGHPDAELMPLGREMAQEMGQVFERVHGIIPVRTRVAVSKMLRSQETALEAGFTDLEEYEVLDEVDTKLPHPELKKSIADRQHSEVALTAAQRILDSPPEEEVWVTHGLVIASLCEVLGVADQFERFVPKFCEIRELPI